jgi:hypothetical protein
MFFFHTHSFLPSYRDPEMLYCMCGKTKDIHRHSWVETADLRADGKVLGKLLKCEKCGELKNHFVS